MRLRAWLGVLFCCWLANAEAALSVASGTVQSGLQAGDRLLALLGAHEGQTQELVATDPLSLQWDWQRCAAMRSCRIRVERAGALLELPLWTDDVLLLPEDAEALAPLLASAPGDTEAEASIAAQIDAWMDAGRRREAAWLQQNLALRVLQRDAADSAQSLQQGALLMLEDAPLLAAQWQLDHALALIGQGQMEVGRRLLDELLASEIHPLMRIRAMRTRAGVDFAGSRFDEAETRLRSVLPLARSQAPGSYLLASTLNSLAVVIRPQGQLAEARELFGEALRTAQAFEPDSVLVGAIASNLGLLERAAGDLSAAEDALHESLRILQARGAPSGMTFDTRSNLALVLLDRGRTRQAAAIWQAAVPDDTDPFGNKTRQASVYQNLALVHAQQGNLGVALQHLQRALTIYRNSAPGTLDEANVQLDIGLYAAQAGELKRGNEALQAALTLYRELTPGGVGVLGTLDALALVALLQGEPEVARDLQQESLALRDGSEQANWHRDQALVQLGRIEAALGREEAALEALQQAERHARLSGRELMLAGALAVRGEVELRRGRAQAAREAACAGVALVEQLRGNSPSGLEYRGDFLHEAAPSYRVCLDALLALEDLPAALDLYQSERQLQLNALIADRDLRFADLPADLAAERQRLLGQLRELSAEYEQADSSAEQLGERREALRRQLRGVEQRILQRLPWLADWQAVGRRAARRTPAGERVLAYAVRDDHTLRILLAPRQRPRFERLPIGAPALREAINGWRKRIISRSGVQEQAQARALYGMLFSGLSLPADAHLRILPDGPLHALPFAALIDGSDRRLVQAHTLQLEALLPSPEGPAAVPGNAIDLLALVDSTGAGQRPPLPGAAAELAAMRGLPWPSMALLQDAQANPLALLRMGPQARRLHFAVHGINDPDSPLDSALLLRDANGRPSPLSVWAVFEDLRLRAELVVLAACDTAPGAEVSDTGWLGLTRAFQFAGADEVVSALWAVDDGGTAELMADFHRRLASGEKPVLALAQSQREMIAAAGAQAASTPRGVGALGASGVPSRGDHPYYWAGFHLYPAPH